MKGGVPLHVPSAADSVWPSLAVPETTGSALFEGAAAATIAVGSLVADAEPPGPVAVTTTRSVLPTSAAAIV